MICCKECFDLLLDYLDGSLDAKTASTLEEHFNDCPPCISFLNTYKSTSHLSRTALSQAQIPEMVQVKLKEFLSKNIPRPGK